jgi:hypothetical protein
VLSSYARRELVTSYPRAASARALMGDPVPRISGVPGGAPPIAREDLLELPAGQAFVIRGGEVTLVDVASPPGS